jgi:hypothetical protein
MASVSDSSLRPATRTPRMSRAHFELIAWTIRNLDVPPAVRCILVDRFSRELAATNGQFNRDRFERACLAVRS